MESSVPVYPANSHWNQMALLEKCVDRLNDIVLITESEPFDEPGNRIVFVNEAFERMTGYSRADVLGKSPRLLQGPKTDREELARIGAALRKWSPVRAELLNYRKDGCEFWVEIDIVPVADERGRFTHWIAIEREITERKHNELLLREAQERLVFALDSAEIGDWNMDLRTNVAVRSLQHDRCFGYSAPVDNWGYETFLSHVHILDRDRVDKIYQAARAGRGDYDVEFRVTWPDGSLHWLWSKGRFYHDADGNPYRVAGIQADVTKRREAELARIAAEAENRRRLLELEHIYQSSPIGMCMISTDYRFLRVNDRLAEMNGLTVAEHIGKTVDEVLPHLAAQIRDTYRPALERGEAVINVEFHGITARDPHRARDWVGNYFPIKSESGEVLGLIANVLEITDRVNAEREIRRLNADLERRVAERTAQLDRSNRELEAFGYSVSHDLRAPLRAIDGWSLALSEDCAEQLSGEGQQYLMRIRSESQRMGTLIDALLDLSRVAQDDIVTQRVDVSVLALAILRGLMERDPARRVELDVEPDLNVMGNEVLLRMLLTNLLENAWKFTSRSAMQRIEVGRIRTGEQPFFVRDSGVGFDMNYAYKLFSPFQRLHRATDFPGTGVGLATVQRIANRHGGRVWVEAVVDRGATFFFTLPASSASELHP